MNGQQDLEKPKAGILKKIFKVLGWLVLSIMLFAGALLGLLFIYEDEVKAAIISELNKHLKSEVKIDPKDIDLTIVKTFPDCAIRFKRVLMLEALPLRNRDTLIFAGELNLHFSIRDLWHKNYNIKKIKLQDGVVKLRILKDGQRNFLFWEPSKATVENNSSLQFNLQLLRLENCGLAYTDSRSGIHTALKVDVLDFKGDFKQSRYAMRSEGRLQIERIDYEGRPLLKNKQLVFSAGLNVLQSQYTITEATVQLNKLQLALAGSFTYNDSLSNLLLRYNTPSLDIAEILSLLPEAYRQKMQDYKSSGNFYAQGSLQYQSENNFMLESDFGIKNGTITYRPTATSLTGVGVEGRLKISDRASLLEVKDLHLELNGDRIRASGRVKDFSDPYLSLTAAAGIHLNNLQAFWPIDTLSRLQGVLKIDADVQGRWQDLKQQAFSTRVKLNASASVKDFEAQFKGDDQVFSIAQGLVTAIDRQMEVRDLALKRGSSDLMLNGTLPGFFNYLSDAAAPLVIVGSLSSNYIRLEDFMLKYKASGGEKPLIPKNISFKLNAQIRKFTYAAFEAGAVRGDIEVKDQKAIVSDMHLNTMEGEAGIDAFADNSHNRLSVVLQSRLKNINISHLFTSFNNFGQSTLQDKHIKGFASADIEFSGSWNNRLEPDLGSLQATCDLNIERGELVDFKPLLSLSKFMDIQDLQRIQFATLQSRIRIANQTITLPKTEIKNSALDLIFWGSHRFDNTIDYHLQLVISELQAKKWKKPDNEFGPLENDPDKKRCAYILMKGTVDKPEIRYDFKGMKLKIKEDVKQETKNVKSILKEEFGFFKKDSTLKKSAKPAPAFQLEKQGNAPPKKTLEPKKKPDEEDF